jgi:hypothetical protein
VELISVLGTLLLLLVGGVVLFPLGLIAYQSFTVPIAPGQTQLGLDGWQAVFSEVSLRTAVGNTLQLTVVRQIVALPLAVLLARQTLVRVRLLAEFLPAHAHRRAELDPAARPAIRSNQPASQSLPTGPVQHLQLLGDRLDAPGGAQR